MFYVIGGITVSVVAFFFTIKFLFELAARVVSFLQNEDRERRGDRTIYDYVRGNYLDPRSCKVSWDWKDPYEVGHSMAFRVHLFYKNGQPFPAHRPVGLRVHISHVELAVEIPVTQEVLQEPSSNIVKVAFTVRRAGRYEISVKLGGLNVAYSPYYKIFQPGMVVPSKTKIVCHFSTLVLTSGQPHTLQIVPRDEYDNPTNNSASLRDEHNYSLSIHELGPEEEESTGVSFEKSVTSNRQTCQVFLRLTLHSRGCFHACISYQNQPINNGEFDIIVLLGVGADLTHSWGPGFSIRASTPQGPSCHMVTALLRDQDKVLLLSPVFSHGINTDRFHHHTGKHNAASQAQREVSSWGVRAGSAVFGSNSSSGFCFLPSSSPPETDAGAQFDFIG
uniref:Apoptosis resistant E3 ubiquitin protein ligase 1 n=1 Tax=Rousettus aegyptiacus TaxID=9407 RepID=A0A7J8IEY8_ROUAE|nr:apoptosis resistant E3 ubiquitin protein ligase 1 [Rousettus aegyptiacus]